MLSTPRWNAEQEMMRKAFPEFQPFIGPRHFGFTGQLRGRTDKTRSRSRPRSPITRRKRPRSSSRRAAAATTSSTAAFAFTGAGGQIATRWRSRFCSPPSMCRRKADEDETEHGNSEIDSDRFGNDGHTRSHCRGVRSILFQIGDGRDALWRARSGNACGAFCHRAWPSRNSPRHFLSTRCRLSQRTIQRTERRIAAA